jgi:hypothetical protein
MDFPTPRFRFQLDPLLAEAKRRMRRRRVLVGFAVVAAVAAMAAVWHPWSGGRAAGRVSGGDTVFSQIPGMTRMLSESNGGGVCSGILGEGPSLAPFCSTRLRGGHEEAWILRTAPRGQRLAQNVNEAFAKSHPGPVLVAAERLSLPSPRKAEQLMRTPAFNMSDYRPAPAVNGGVARHIDGWYFQGCCSAPTRTGSPEIRFFWASGRTVVIVDVIGAELTAAEAQQIALLAKPR